MKNKLLCNNKRKFWTHLLHSEVELTFERRMVKCNSIQWYHFHLPLEKQERNWSRNASRSCFWDRWWGLAGQLLAIFPLSPVTFPDVFAKVRSILSPSSFTSDKFRRYALDPIGLNPLRHLMKFAQPRIPYRFGIVIKVKQQYWLGWSTENSNYG